jgi:outer membrane protein assembly factor BamD
MKKIIFCLVLFIFFWQDLSFSFWIWTPESKRWVNPKYMAKDTPSEQLAYALSFFENKNYKRALAEFKRLISRYPKSKEAAEAQYYIGLVLEDLNKLYDAYLAYQKLIEKYPFSERIDEAVERQYKIGEQFMTKEIKFLGIEIPQHRYAIEIFDAVIKNAPYSKYAPIAQYKIGLILKSLARFSEAKEEFDKVVSNYPESEWVEAAKFQIADCLSRISLSAPYDQRVTKEAREKFEKFVRSHPDAKLSKEAEAQIITLREKEAESNFEIGRFYEKQKKFESAKIYYEYVFTNFPKTKWAVKAFERYQVLEMQ